MKIYEELGKIAIGSRLRLLTEKITTDATQLYQLYGVDLQPKWFPVYYVLANGETKTITAIAREIGHSHPSVSKIVGEMLRKGLVVEKKDKKDGRRNVIALTQKGNAITAPIANQYTDVKQAIAELSAAANHDLWKAIEEWDYLLSQKNLLRRVQEQKKIREGAKVQIVNYSAKYQQAFRELNEEWISTYFKMEEADHQALDNPRKSILARGGHILVALYEGEAVGVCALLKMKDPDYDYELAKMAVSPKAQGKNIGWLLGQAIIEKARSVGARNLFLESNTVLKPAISLYHKLGFRKVTGHDSPYERSNIQMALSL